MIPVERRLLLTGLAEEYAGHLDKAMTYLSGRGITEHMADEFGLGYVHEGRYETRLSIPYYTPGGVVGIKYRCTQHENCKAVGCVKYLYEMGDGTHLYNAYALLKAERAFVVEGELKAVVVQSHTGIPTVGYPGTENWQNHFRLCFEGITNIVVIADDGKPGHRAAENVTRKLGSHARVVYTPEGEDDPDSLIHRLGVDAFMALIGA